MLATAFSIFNATKHLPKRNNLPPWAPAQKIWPQVLLLVIACISLVFSVFVMIAYSRGGHHRAEKVAAYYTVFAVGFFIFSIIMWAVGAIVFNQSKSQGNGKDMWGWSCVENPRRHLFEDDVAYGLMCRLQVSNSVHLSTVSQLTATLRTGLSSAASSKSSSKPSASSSTQSSSTDSGPSASSESPWPSATRLAPISTSPSSAPSPHPTRLASVLSPRALAAGNHHQATPSTTTRNPPPRTAKAIKFNTRTRAKSLNRSPSLSKRHQSRSPAPPPKSTKTASNLLRGRKPHPHPCPPASTRGKTTTLAPHPASSSMPRCPSPAPTSRLRAPRTRRNRRRMPQGSTSGPR